ncbi:MAG: hypothetical protein AB7F50_09570 [Fimbriimonadaceae bacterium]
MMLVIAALVLCAVTVACKRPLATSSSSALPQRSIDVRSDPHETRLRLAKIARALELYRVDYPAKPVSVWRTYRDAGLPFFLHTLTEPGHTWSLGLYDIYPVTGYSETRAITADQAFNSAYLHLWKLPKEVQAKVWRRNGTRQVIVADLLIDRGIKPVRRTIVLRYDGSIEEVEYESFESLVLAGR